MREREPEAMAQEIHRRVWDLLPWHANATLNPAERAEVEQHLESCVACREELALCRVAGEAVHETRDGAWEPPAEQLDRLLSKLPPSSVSRPDAGPLTRIREWWQALPRPVGWVLAGESAAVAILAAVVLWQATGPEPSLYETLSSAAPLESTSAAQLQIAFGETTTEPQLRNLLRTAGASIVRGPSELGIYTIALDPSAETERAVRRLRADPHVRLVEPLADLRP